MCQLRYSVHDYSGENHAYARKQFGKKHLRSWGKKYYRQMLRGNKRNGMYLSIPDSDLFRTGVSETVPCVHPRSVILPEALRILLDSDLRERLSGHPHWQYLVISVVTDQCVGSYTEHGDLMFMQYFQAVSYFPLSEQFDYDRMDYMQRDEIFQRITHDNLDLIHVTHVTLEKLFSWHRQNTIGMRSALVPLAGIGYLTEQMRLGECAAMCKLYGVPNISSQPNTFCQQGKHLLRLDSCDGTSFLGFLDERGQLDMDVPTADILTLRRSLNMHGLASHTGDWKTCLCPTCVSLRQTT